MKNLFFLFFCFSLLLFEFSKSTNQQQLWSQYSTAIASLYEPQFNAYCQRKGLPKNIFQFQIVTQPNEISRFDQPHFNIDLGKTIGKFSPKPNQIFYEPKPISIYEEYKEALINLGANGKSAFISLMSQLNNENSLWLEDGTTSTAYGSLEHFQKSSINSPIHDNIFINSTSVYRTTMITNVNQNSQAQFVSKFVPVGSKVVQESIRVFSENFYLRFRSKGVLGIAIKPGSWLDKTLLNNFKPTLKKMGYFSNGKLSTYPRIIWVSLQPKIEMRLTEKEFQDMKNQWSTALGISVGNILFTNKENIQKYQISVVNPLAEKLENIIMKQMKKYFNKEETDIGHIFDFRQKEELSEEPSEREFELMKKFLNYKFPKEKKIKIKTMSDTENIAASIRFRANRAGLGWDSWKVGRDVVSGTTGQRRPLTQVQIELENPPPDSSIVYRVHSASIGWGPWVRNGQVAGNPSRQIEAIEIRLEGILSQSSQLEYNAHCQDVGWVGFAREGSIAGTTGQSRRMESLRIRINEKIPVGQLNDWISLEYQSHVQNSGWEEWKNPSSVTGTWGLSRRLEAIKIRLVGAPPFCHVWYRLHISGYGWLPFVKDGEQSGTTGQSRRAEAIQIYLENMPDYQVKYRAHSESIGWQNYVYDGAIAGTTGQSRRLEAVEIFLLKNMITTSFETKSNAPQIIAISSQEFP